MPSRYRFSAQILGKALWSGANGRQGAKRTSPEFGGQANLTRRYRSALVAVLACASLFVTTSRRGRQGAAEARARPPRSEVRQGREARRKEGGKGQIQAQQINRSKDGGAAGAAGEGAAAPDSESESRWSGAHSPACARRRRQGDRHPGRHLGSGGAQARRMDHPEQRQQRRHQQALSRFHRRQSELAEPRDVLPPRRGAALGRESPAGTSPEILHGSPPQSGVGRLVLARALLAQGDTEGASALVREVWRSDALTAEIEKQALERYSTFLSRPITRRAWRSACSPPTTRPRCGRRAAWGTPTCHRAGAHRARAQGRQGHNKEKNLADARKLLDTVPAEARNDPGYIFAHMRVLRRAEKFAEATQVMLSAPTRPCPDPRSGGVVGRTAHHVAQAARSRRPPLRLSRGGGGGRADQGKLAGRAPFHGRLDRAAVPR